MASPESGPQIECPDERRWHDVASGSEDAKMAVLLSEHAATCRRCAELLRNAIWILSDDHDAEESRFLPTLDSSQLAWQQKTARNLAGQLEKRFDQRRRQSQSPDAVESTGSAPIGGWWRPPGSSSWRLSGFRGWTCLPLPH